MFVYQDKISGAIQIMVNSNKPAPEGENPDIIIDSTGSGAAIVLTSPNSTIRIENDGATLAVGGNDITPLEPASTTSLGGVIVGDGLSVAEDGTISVTG